VADYLKRTRGHVGAAAALAYTKRALASSPENLLFLLEQLWRETRREQSRANRWLTWARLRAQRRKERS